jgi:hypothetical protein
MSEEARFLVLAPPPSELDA